MLLLVFGSMTALVSTKSVVPIVTVISGWSAPFIILVLPVSSVANTRFIQKNRQPMKIKLFL